MEEKADESLSLEPWTQEAEKQRSLELEMAEKQRSLELETTEKQRASQRCTQVTHAAFEV